MSDEGTSLDFVDNAPKAKVDTKRSFSIIWVVPIIALLIGGLLTFKALSEKGPTIFITFKSADGLVAGKTKVKYKDVEVGQVTEIKLKEDLSGVVLSVEMDNSSDLYMVDQTRFWVVRARVGAGEVSGLGTLFSGAYIGCSPATEGTKTRHFEGLEKPPVITAGLPGRHFVLNSKTLGSLDVGTQIFYHGIKVGQVVEYALDQQYDNVELGIFIDAPYHEKVHQNTRFWDVSGFDMKLDAEGVQINTESFVSMMVGGIAFDVPDFMQPNELAEENQHFKLYRSRSGIEERVYTIKRKCLLYFEQNVRGLEVGAPVEIRGIRIGEVVDVKLELDADTLEVRAAVFLIIEPERIDTIFQDKTEVVDKGKLINQEKLGSNLERLVAKGMRAQLKTGNLLTGQLYVDLDFFPNAAEAKFHKEGGYYVLPTQSNPFGQIAQRVNNILKKVEKMPLDQIGQNLATAVKTLNSTLQALGQTAGGVNQELIPEIKASLEDVQRTVSGIEQTFGPDSAISYNTQNVLSELSATIRSLRALIDYIERNPEAVIFGKEAE